MRAKAAQARRMMRMPTVPIDPIQVSKCVSVRRRNDALGESLVATGMERIVCTGCCYIVFGVRKLRARNVAIQ